MARKVWVFSSVGSKGTDFGVGRINCTGLKLGGILRH